MFPNEPIVEISRHPSNIFGTFNRRNIRHLIANCRNQHSLGIPVSSTNKTDRHDITEILLKVALNTINTKH
jgi:hypothetical protein